MDTDYPKPFCFFGSAKFLLKNNTLNDFYTNKLVDNFAILEKAIQNFQIGPSEHFPDVYRFR